MTAGHPVTFNILKGNLKLINVSMPGTIDHAFFILCKLSKSYLF